jgi:hypothetical protein
MQAISTAVDRGLDVAALRVPGIAGQLVLHQDRPSAACQDRDAVPGPLSPPDGLIAGIAERCLRKARVGRLELLQADDIRPRRAQPFEQVRQPADDIVDVEGCDLHRAHMVGASSRMLSRWMVLHASKVFCGCRV